MGTHHSSGGNQMSFGSFDNVEDALEILDKSSFPYLLLLPNRKNTFLIYSNLGGYVNNDTMIDLLESGHINNAIRQHLNKDKQ
jgi:hypothetical protein